MENTARRDVAVGAPLAAALVGGTAAGVLPFSGVEALGFVTGAASVWLLVRGSVWTWPIGIATAACFLVVFAEARLFADGALQLVYVALGVWGWWYWLHGGAGRTARPMGRVGAREAGALAALVVAGSFALTLYLRSVGDSAPAADATTTVLSLAAVWLQARKHLETWLVWLAADAIYVPLYFAKGLPLTGVLYVVFAAMCVKGLADWRRSLAAQRWRRGAVVGKFHPPHSGHEHLIRTALGRVGELTAIVVARAGELDGELRRRWLAEAFPDATVLLYDQDASGLADDDTAGWARETARMLGGAPDVVFTSERYGPAWVRAMGAAHVTVDRRRRAYPVSGTAIRADPRRHLAYLTGGARAHYVARVCLLGAESTGKTTLARALAERYGTLWVPEHGHVHSWFRAKPAADWATWTTAELVQVARTQAWYEDFLAAYASRVLFCDTDVWTTGLFHERYLGRRSEEIDALATRVYDLYIVCDGATPFAQDEHGTRTDGPHRAAMHAAYVQRVRALGAPFVVVSGRHGERIAQAVAAVDAMLASSRDGGHACRKRSRSDRSVSSSRTRSARHAAR